MEEKKDDEHQIPEDSSKLAHEYLQRASYLGTIFPLLEIAYETLIEKRIKKYNLNIVKEFWIYFGLLILTSIYFIFGISFEVVIFFLLATIFTLIIYNLDFFKNRLLPDETYEIQRFIVEIDNKPFIEVIEFIKDHRNKLKENDIKLIINSKHGKSWSLYKFLLNYQNFSSEILVYIIETNKVEIVGEGLFKKYISRFDTGMSFKNYTLLIDYFKDNKKIIKVINRLNPNFLKSSSNFKNASISIQSFYISIRQGKISDTIKFLSIALVLIVSIIGFSQIIGPYMKMEPYKTFPILIIINYFFALAITAAIIILLITWSLIILTKIIWFIIGIFAPDQPQI